jgi:hypothetical protein
MEMPKPLEVDEGEEIDMSYEEFLIYSARIGEKEDVQQMLEEAVDLASVDTSGNTALRKFYLRLIRKCRHGLCERAH